MMLRLMDFLPCLVEAFYRKRLALILSSSQNFFLIQRLPGPASLLSSHTWRASICKPSLGSGLKFLVVIVYG